MLSSYAAPFTRYRQPCDALEPEAFTLEAAEEWTLKRASSLSPDHFRLTSFWYLDYVRQQVPGEIKKRYTMRLVQAENYGIACGPVCTLQDSDHLLVGEDARQILIDRRYRDDIDRTALIDLVIGHVSAPANNKMVLDQALRDKYAIRSCIFADEAERALRRKGLDTLKKSKPRILVIGATTGMIGALAARDFEVTATDLSADVVGQNLGGVTVCDEAENSRLIETADLAVITGMTLANRTLPVLIEAAKAHNTSILIWAITGRNFGSYYIRHGIDCAVSDPSPFLLLPGPASIGICRRED